MPIRPTSMVKMMTSFPEMLSNGLKFKLNPTVLSADTTSILYGENLLHCLLA